MIETNSYIDCKLFYNIRFSCETEYTKQMQEIKGALSWKIFTVRQISRYSKKRTKNRQQVTMACGLIYHIFKQCIQQLWGQVLILHVHVLLIWISFSESDNFMISRRQKLQASHDIVPDVSCISTNLLIL